MKKANKLAITFLVAVLLIFVGSWKHFVPVKKPTDILSRYDFKEPLPISSKNERKYLGIGKRNVTNAAIKISKGG
jgi:hypothetical protein